MTVGGDISDGAKTIYDSASGRLDYSVLPYHKGDLTSDWASNSYTSGYYDVSALSAENVGCGVSYGRGSTGASRAGCLTCYGCGGADCVARSVDGPAATDLGCTVADEGCRRCDNGTCTIYADYAQHLCSTGDCCSASGTCYSIPSSYCSSQDGVFITCGGDKIMCSEGKMWSTSSAGCYNWTGAISYCDSLSYGAFTDWHEPSSTEWALSSPAITKDNCASWDPLHSRCSGYYGTGYYWSSTQHTTTSYGLYWRFFNNPPSSSNQPKTSLMQVRCMRG